MLKKIDQKYQAALTQLNNIKDPSGSLEININQMRTFIKHGQDDIIYQKERLEEYLLVAKKYRLKLSSIED